MSQNTSLDRRDSVVKEGLNNQEYDPVTEGNEDTLPPPVSAQRPLWKSIMLVLVCTLAMMINLATSSTVPIFLPNLAKDFDVGEDSLQWVVSAFTLSSGCLLIFFGRIADLYGRKKMFLVGTAWLTVFSLGCGFAKNLVTMNILRGLQGLGPAAFIPASLGILAHSFPSPRGRTFAFATFSSGAPIGGAIGTQIGAVLTQDTAPSWRSFFYLFAGLTLLCNIGGLLIIDQDQKTPGQDLRVDWLGALIITAGLALLTFGLGDGSLAPHKWGTPYIITVLVLGVVLVLGFIAWQYYLERDPKRVPPLMKLSLWSRMNGKFAVMQMIAFFEWSAFLSWYFWAQLYYEDFKGLPPIQTAIRLLPMTVTGIACNVLIALLIGRVDLVIIITVGTAMTGLGALLFAIINPNSTYWSYGFVSTIVAVFGGDFVFAAGTLFLAKISRPDEQSLSGGLFQTLTQLGTAFGLAITTIVHDSVSKESDALKTPLGAYKAAQWTSFGMAMFCSLLSILFLRGVGPVGQPPDQNGDIIIQGHQNEKDEKQVVEP